MTDFCHLCGIEGGRALDVATTSDGQTLVVCLDCGAERKGGGERTWVAGCDGRSFEVPRGTVLVSPGRDDP